jgi:hypothetical protein
MIIAVIRPTMIDRTVNSGDFEAVLATDIGLSRSVLLVKQTVSLRNVLYAR